MKTFAAIVFLVLQVNGQDFGYAYYSMTDFRSLGVSYQIQDFSPSASNTLSDSSTVRFSTPMLMIEYREMSARVAVGYQSYTLLGKNRNAFTVQMESGNDFPVSGREQRNGFFIPLKLSVNYLRAENSVPGQKNFDVGSLGAGTGAKYRYLSREFGMQASATGSLHYSSVGFGTEYGSQTSLTGEIQFIFPEVLFDGAIVGYRYEHQEWNMSDAGLNYRRFYHGPFVGIFF